MNFLVMGGDIAVATESNIISLNKICRVGKCFCCLPLNLNDL